MAFSLLMPIQNFILDRYDMWTLFFLIFLGLCLGIAAWLFFLWAVKSGQYEDPERPKFRMLEDEEEKKGK
jgi:cbb3-type cytochrome oxidase maturation protein